MPDFIPQSEATSGLEASAPTVPYAPSSLGERLVSGVGHYTSELSDYFEKQEAQDSGYYAGGHGEGTIYVAPQPKISPQVLKQKYPGVSGLDEPMPESVARVMQREQQDAQNRQNILDRYPRGFGNAALGFGADVVASLLDPVGDAAFMVPVVGEARYAAWLARAGESAGLVGRLGVTAGVGGLRGIAGQAMLSGGELYGDPDMSLGDAAHDMLTAGVSGAILHTGLRFHGDVLGARFAATDEGAAAGSDATLHDAATRTAASQIASNNPVDVRPVFDAARYRSSLMQSTAVDQIPPRADPLSVTRMDDAIERAAGLPDQAEAARADAVAVARLSKPETAVDAQLAEAERAVSGLRAAGKITADDEELLAAPLREADQMAKARSQAAQCLAAGEI